jgi:hypothetical protein
MGKKFLFLLFLCNMLFLTSLLSQTTTLNSDFKLGNFNGWTVANGTWTTTTPPAYTNTTVTNNRETIISVNTLDPNTCNGLSTIPPDGGKYVARLGYNINKGLVEQLKYKMTVTASNALFVYEYAVVFEDPGHPDGQQPFFEVAVTDQLGNPIDSSCGYSKYVSGAKIPGFNECILTGNDTVRWKPWTSVALNLSSYIGQTIQIQFTAADCSVGKHWGYAYMEAKTSPFGIIVKACESDSDAVLTAPIGFTSYLWSNGSTTRQISIPHPLNGSQYTCEMTSTTQCSVLLTATIALESTHIAPSDITICKGNSATLTANGANSYTWSNGLGTGATVTVAPINTTLYVVTGISTSGCVGTGTAHVSVNELPSVTVLSQSICYAQSTSLDAIGANSYNWDGGIVNNQPFTPTVTKTYNVTGTDLNGCKNSATASVTVIPLPTIVTSVATICVGGATTLTASGAVSYSWSDAISNGAFVSPTKTQLYTVTGTDSKSCSNTASTTVTVNPLPTITAVLPTICVGQTTVLLATGASSYIWDGGITNAIAFTPSATKIYNVTGTDNKGCKSYYAALVSVNHLPEVSVISSASTVCFGQSTKLSGQGATSYIWNNNISDNVSFAPLTTRTYNVTGTDNNGCINTSSTVITVNPLPTITALSPIICLGQSAKLIGVGATSYIWNANVYDNTAISPIITTIYSVTGTDTKGCSNTATAQITVNPLPTITAALPIICFGKSTLLTATGALSYSWDGGIINNTVFTPSATKIYNVIGTDVNGCKSTSSALVTVNPLPTVTALSTPSSLCLGKSTTLQGHGAQSYIWDNGIQDNNPFKPITTKTYTVTGIDNNGCVNTSSLIVTVNPLPTITAVSPTICLGQSTKLSGVGAHSYVWNGSAVDNTPISPIITTVYNVTGTDLNGCANTASSQITVNPLPTITAALPIICFGKSTLLTATGALSYSWDGGIINNTVFTPSATKIYNVIGTDVNGCKSTSSALVTVNPLPNVTALSTPSSLCIGKTTTLNGSGAVSYDWNSGVINNVAFAPLSTQLYSVTGTDINGCKSSAVIKVTVFPLPNVYASADPMVICIGDSTFVFGNGAQSYVWDSGVTNATMFAPTSTQQYKVSGTDYNGCVNTASISVIVNNLPVLTFKPLPVICEYVLPFKLNYVSPLGGVFSGDGVSYTTFSPSVAGAGIHDIHYSFTDTNGCANSISQTISVNPKPVLTFNLDQQRCYDAGLLQLTANPVGGTFTGVGVVGQMFDPTIPVSETQDPITYGYTDPNTGCTDTIVKDITVHYTPPPVVYNVQTSTIDLQKSITAIGDGTMHWYDDALLHTNLFIGNPYFHGYTSTIVRYYYITQVINGCESISDTMRLKIVSCGTHPPIVDQPGLKCMYQPLDSIKVKNVLVDNKVATVIWRDQNDMIVSNAVAFAPPFNKVGSITYQVALDTSGCEGAAVNVTWSRYKTPVPVVNPVSSPCEGFAIPTFQATNIHGTVKWYSDPTIDTLVAQGSMFNSSASQPGLHYFWLTNNDVCISDPVRVQLLIYKKPSAPNGDLLYQSCQGSPLETMSVTPVVGTTWYDSLNNVIAIDTPSYIPPVKTLKLDQTVRYSTIYFNGHCYSDPFYFDYLLKRKPPKPILHPDTICIGSRPILKVDSGSSITWHFPALHKDYNGLQIKPDITEIGTYSYTVWDELNGCKSDISTDSLIAGPTPQNGIIGPTKICENTTKQPFGVTSHHPKSSYVWKVTGNRVIYKSTESVQYYSSIDFIQQGIDTIYVTEKNEFGCSATDSSIIRIAPKPTVDFIYDVPKENYKYYFTNITDSLYITDGTYKELLPLYFNWNFGRESDTLIPQSWTEYLKDTVYKENYHFGSYDIWLNANPVGYVCNDTISKKIYVDIKEALFVPTAFCPDHSSPNLNVFTAKGYNLKTFKMWVYDYWGNLLFYTDKLYNGQPLEGWNGTFNGVIQKVDTYVWKVQAEFLDGVIWPGQAGAKTDGNITFGNVLLFR